MGFLYHDLQKKMLKKLLLMQMLEALNQNSKER